MQEKMPGRVNHDPLGKGNKLPPPSGKDFAVPEGYFDTLPGRIQQRIAISNPRRERFFQMIPAKKFFHAVAATVTIAAVVSGLLLIRPSVKDLHLSLNDDALAMDIIHLYAALDPDIIFNIILDSDMTEDEIQFGYTETDFSGSDNDDIFDYLERQFDIFWMEDADIEIQSN